MGMFDIFKKNASDPAGGGMSENQQYAHDTIVKKVKMGFDSPGTVREIMQEMLDYQDLGADVSQAWMEQIIDREFAQLNEDQYSWNRPTDPDRLAKAFNELCTEKIIALHNAGYTTSDGEEDVVAVEWQLRDKGMQSEGDCFYHEQDLERAIDPDSKKLLVAFQKIDNSDDAVTLAVGQKVADKLRQHGFTVNWSGSVNEKIEIAGIEWNKLHDYDDDHLYTHGRVVKIMTGRS